MPLKTEMSWLMNFEKHKFGALRVHVDKSFLYLPYLVLRAITDGSKIKNDRKLVLYVVKSTFLPIAGVQRMRALDLRAYVHVDAEAVPTRYRTPAHSHTRPRSAQH